MQLARNSTMTHCIIFEFAKGGQSLDIVYLAKAFVKVIFKLLIWKILSLSVKGNVLDWLSDFLHQIKQCVSMNGQPLSWQLVSSGDA